MKKRKGNGAILIVMILIMIDGALISPWANASAHAVKPDEDPYHIVLLSIMVILIAVLLRMLFGRLFRIN